MTPPISGPFANMYSDELAVIAGAPKGGGGGGGDVWPPPVDPSPPGGIPAGVLNVSGRQYWEPGYYVPNQTGPFEWDEEEGMWRWVTSTVTPPRSCSTTTRQAALNSVPGWVDKLNGNWDIYVLMRVLNVDGPLGRCTNPFPVTGIGIATYDEGYYQVPGAVVNKFIAGSQAPFSGDVYAMYDPGIYSGDYDYPSESLITHTQYGSFSYDPITVEMVGAPNMTVAVLPQAQPDQIVYLYVGIMPTP